MRLLVCWQAVLSESSRDGQDGVWLGQWVFGRLSEKLVTKPIGPELIFSVFFHASRLYCT
jgi:hypothetical protein